MRRGVISSKLMALATFPLTVKQRTIYSRIFELLK
jgi:hypothetical protein